jgi:GMP synthase (glutamine-hydrolysing)
LRVLTVLHQRDAGPGVFAEAAAAAGHELVEWMAPDGPPPALDGFGAAMVFGGAMHVDQEQANPWLDREKALLRDLLARGTPLLGVCLGAQLLSEAAGGAPRRAARPEIGWHEIALTEAGLDDPLLSGLDDSFEVFNWHSYEASPPAGATLLAASDVCVQAYRLENRSWGIQFHAEVTSEGLSRWLDDYDNDEDAVRIGVDPEALRAETEGKIRAWNDVGRGICRRFLSLAVR